MQNTEVLYTTMYNLVAFLFASPLLLGITYLHLTEKVDFVLNIIDICCFNACKLF